MAKKIKIGLVFIVCGLIFIFFFLNVRINDDNWLIRTMVGANDSYLLVEDKDGAYTLSFLLDGRRQNLKGFATDMEEDAIYFFLPSGINLEHVRVLVNNVGESWNCIEENGLNIKIEKKADDVSELFLHFEDNRHSWNRKIVFMTTESIPSMFITMDGELEELKENKELEFDCNIEIFSKNAELQSVGEADIHGHGNSTWEKIEKKSWALQYKVPIEILGLTEGEKYICVSNGQDLSYIRNKFVYDMAQGVGLQYTPRSEYADLYVNGEYQGLYLITDKIDASETKIPIKKGNSDLSEEEITRLTPYSKDGDRGYIWPEDLEADEATGYLLCKGSPRDYKSIILGDYKVLYPKYPSEKQLDNIKGFIIDFEMALNNEDGRHPKTQKHYTEYIDVDSFVKKHLIEQISKNADGTGGSLYFYMMSYEDDAVLFEGPVWDYDNALGNYRFSAMWRQPKGMVSLAPEFEGHPEFEAMMIHYYKMLFKPYLEEKADVKIAGYVKRIKKSVKMDQVRWHGNPFWEGTFEENVEEVIDFLQIRKQFLDEVWLEGKVYYRINYVDGDQIVYTDYVAADGYINNNYLPEGEGGRFVGWYDEDLEKKFDFSQPVTDDMAVWAKWE